MKEIVERIGSYNLFNYLLPGSIYVGAIEKMTTIKIIDENLLISGFICYFVGMVISRIGSLIMEPLLKKANFLKFGKYEDYVEASKKDNLIITLSEQNNTYRTIISMMLMIIISILYDHLRNFYQPIQSLDTWVIFIGVLVLFMFAYQKQTKFITRRINRNKNV